MLSVVIVEDDRKIAELHQHFIAACGQYRVVGVAESVRDAEQLVQLAKPDLVIVDNYLPDGRGVELVGRWLNSVNKTECILITAANDAETVRLAHRYGAFDYLVKPINYARLTDSLNRFAIMKRYVSGQDVLRQSELDEVFHPLQSKTSDLAGLDLFTLQRVLELFTHAHVEQSAATIGEYLGVSKSTARRYLDKAVEQGELEAFLAHGKVGRPTRFYRTKRSW